MPNYQNFWSWLSVAKAKEDAKLSDFDPPGWQALSSIYHPDDWMRGNTMTFAQYIGKHNSNLGQYLGSDDAKRSGNYGDMGPPIALRLLTPDSTLSNSLQIRGTLKTSGDGSGPDQSTQQEMVVIVVADSMLDGPVRATRGNSDQDQRQCPGLKAKRRHTQRQFFCACVYAKDYLA